MRLVNMRDLLDNTVLFNASEGEGSYLNATMMLLSHDLSMLHYNVAKPLGTHLHFEIISKK